MLGFKAFALFALAAFGANAIPIGGADTSVLNGPLDAAGAHINVVPGNTPAPRGLPLGGAPAMPGVTDVVGTLTGTVAGGAVGAGTLPGLRREDPTGGLLASVEGLKSSVKGPLNEFSSIL